MQFKFLRDLSKFDVLHIDDWAVASGIEIDPLYRTGLYEIINQCSGRTSILTSGVPPVETWAELSEIQQWQIQSLIASCKGRLDWN